MVEGCGPLGRGLGSLLAEDKDKVGERVTFAETHHHTLSGVEVKRCMIVVMCICTHVCVCVCVCVRVRVCACLCVYATLYKSLQLQVCVYRHSCCATPSLDSRPLVRDC